MINKNRRYFLNRLFNKLFSHPLHFSVCYVYSFIFGSVKSKIKNDVFVRPYYAFGIYEAALRAKQLGLSKVSCIEFGVANGKGLSTMAIYSKKIEKIVDVEISVVGFDSGEGMPMHEGYKDHPEIYVQGDFPMQDFEQLRKILPSNAKLILANLNTEDWTKYIEEDAPIGFVAIDVDYYSSTRNILKHLDHISAKKLLPSSLFYFDDVILDNHNTYQGELLAINEFNATSGLKKFDSYHIRLKQRQRFYNDIWLSQIYQLHCMDHPVRSEPYRKQNEAPQIITNRYLKA